MLQLCMTKQLTPTTASLSIQLRPRTCIISCRLHSNSYTFDNLLSTVAKAMQPAQTLGRHAAAAARGLPPCILTYTHICAVRACHSGSKQTCRSAAEQSLQDTQQRHDAPQSHQQQWQQQQQQASRALQEQQQQQQSVEAAAAPADPLLPVDDWTQRSRLLVGAEGLAKLASLNVLLVGLGGVGSFAGEWRQLTGFRGSLHRLCAESFCVGWWGAVVQHAMWHSPPNSAWAHCEGLV